MQQSHAYNQSLVRSTSNSNALINMPLPAWTAPVQTVLLFEVRYTWFDMTNPNETDSPAGHGDAVWGANTGNGNTSKQYATGEMSYMAIDGSACNWKDANGNPFPAAHFEGANYLAGDGHVKWLKGSSVASKFGLASDPSDNSPEGTQYSGPGKHALTFSPI